ncbi:hypothetical protein CR513_00544, partial [Mucuna pruriens]
MFATTQDLQTQIGQLDTTLNQLQAKGFGQIPSQTIISPQANVSAITSRSGRAFQARKLEIDDELLQTFSKVEINIPLLDAIKQIPKYAKFLKGDMEVGRNVFALIKSEQVSALIQLAMPKKCSDLDTFSVLCILGKCNFDALLDLSSSNNVMPSPVYKFLRFGALEPTSVVVELTNRSAANPLGILEYMMVQVNNMIFPAYFYVLDIKDGLYSKGPTLILSTPFLKIAKTKIDVHARTLAMEFGDNKVEYNIFEAMKYPTENHSVFCLNVIDQLGDDYVNLHSEFPDFHYFADCDCTCVGLNECPICVEISSAINAIVGVVDIASIDIIGFSYELEQTENNNRTLKELATSDYLQLELTQSYKLKLRLIHLLPKFHGLAGEDSHKHLKECHVVCSTMRPQGIPEDYIKMKFVNNNCTTNHSDSSDSNNFDFKPNISHELEKMENNNRTLKELATPDVLYQPWCIKYQQLELAQSYELKSGLIHLLPKFHGLASEDPHKHLKEFYGIPEDDIKIKVFPFSLDRAVKYWLYL